MKVSAMYPDKWLAAKHLQGRSVTVAVERVTVENLYNPRTKHSEPKFVVQFYKKQLRLVLNKTQALALAAITGSDDSDDWKGHLVTLSPSIAPNKAETITISRPPEQPKAQAQEQPPADTRDEIDRTFDPE